MNESTNIRLEAKRLRLLAAALELQHYTSTAANVVLIPGGDQVIAIGTPAEVARLLEIAPADSDNVAAILDEVARATRKFPTWPTDPLHAIAVLGEEFGELTKAVLQTTYEPHKVQADELRTEAIQTAAMSLRFVASLDRYVFAKCEQHQQPAMAAIQPKGGAA